MLILSVAWFLFGIFLIFNGYQIHRLTEPECFAGLTAGVSFGVSVLSLVAFTMR